MVTASILFNTNVTLGTVLGMCRNIVCSFTVVSAFGQPSFDGVAVCGGMVGVATLEAEPGLAVDADRVLGHAVHGFDHDRTVRTRAKSQVRVASDIVEEAEVDVPFPHLGFSHLR